MGEVAATAVGRQRCLLGLTPDGLISFCRVEGRNFLGYQDTDLLGRAFASLFDEDKQVSKTFFNGAVARPARGPDGFYHYVVWEPADGGCVYMEDMTQTICQQQAERLGRVYTFPFQHIGDAVLLINQAERIVFANPSAMRILSRDGQPMEGQALSRWIPSWPKPWNREQSVSVKSHVRLEATRLSCTVTVRTVPYEGEDYQMVVLRDMAERVPEVVWQAEENFRLLVEGVDEYAIYALDPEGRVMTWNAGATRIKGYTPTEIIGRYFGCFYPPEDQQAGKPARVLAQAAEQGRYIEEGERVRKDGSRFWASVVVTAIRDDNGTLRGFVKITRDVTERRREEQLERERNAAQEREKARQRFLQIAAHELRNPMQGIRGILELIQERADCECGIDERPSLVAMMTKEVDRMSTLLDDVLEAYRIDDPGFRINQAPMDLHAAITSALAPMKAACPDYVFDVQLSPAAQRMWGDRLRLEGVIRNLLDNAVKYSPPGSCIRVTTSRGREGLHIAVADQGMGIPENEIGQVFEGFFRGSNLGKKDPGGMGLGLHLCRQIVERHGGRIWAESLLGCGTTIHMIFQQGEAETNGASAAS